MYPFESLYPLSKKDSETGKIVALKFISKKERAEMKLNVLRGGK
eukprot:UN18352